MAKKTAAQLERELREYFGTPAKRGRRVAHVGFGTFPKSKFTARVRTPTNPAGRTETEQLVHPEMFYCKDRHGKILGMSTTIRGAMAKAPYDKSYAVVRGEYTSDGSHWGPGKGRQLAIRENGSWIVG